MRRSFEEAAFALRMCVPALAFKLEWGGKAQTDERRGEREEGRGEGRSGVEPGREDVDH